MMKQAVALAAGSQQPLEPDRRSLTPFRHRLRLIPSSRLNVESETCDRCIAAPTVCVVVASDRIRSLVTYLSHTAFFHSNERIAPSNRGIKHLVDERGDFGDHQGASLICRRGRHSGRRWGRQRLADCSPSWRPACYFEE
jgi:hypothetical protein